jgi:hypothetical protein
MALRLLCRYADVRLRRILPHEQQGLIARNGQRIAEAIAKVERSAMPSATERACRISGECHMIGITRHDVCADSAKECV